MASPGSEQHINHDYQRAGVSQTDRLVRALSPDQFVADERSLKVLLSQFAHLTEKINHYTALPDGGLSTTSWDFLQHRSIFVLSLISTYPIDSQFAKLSKFIKELIPETSRKDALKGWQKLSVLWPAESIPIPPFQQLIHNALEPVLSFLQMGT